MILLSTLSCRGVSNSIQKLRIVYQSLARNANCKKPVIYQSFHSSERYKFKVKNAIRFNSHEFVAEAQVNTKVKNNVILYKNERTKDFMVLKVIFFGWLIICSFMAFGTYDPKFITTWSEYLAWTDYIKAHGLSLLYFTYAICIGPMACILFYILNERFIRYIILHKGGNEITIITNHLLKNGNSFTIPANEVQTTLTRQNMKNYLPVKVKGRYFYFILDGQGQFLNTPLFDHTIGVQKRWKK